MDLDEEIEYWLRMNRKVASERRVCGVCGTRHKNDVELTIHQRHCNGEKKDEFARLKREAETSFSGNLVMLHCLVFRAGAMISFTHIEYTCEVMDVSGVNEGRRLILR